MKILLSVSDHLLRVAFVVFVLFAVFAVAMALRQERAAARCMRAGYAEAKRVDGETFCVRRVNGTDEVVPLARAGGAERAP